MYFRHDMANLTLEEYRKRLVQVTKDLEKNRDANAIKISLDALAIVKSRVINDGLNAEGAAFSKYNPEYQKLRVKKGLNRQTNNKNFTFTADMWKNIIPKVVKSTKVSTTIRYGSNDKFSFNKLIWNSEREGRSIVDLSDDELKVMGKLNRERVLKAFENNGLGTVR